MHIQPVFRGVARVGGEVAEDLFRRGICLPSSSSMTADDQQRVIAVVRRALTAATV
jgi:pyridoxal phosphate-dependent aminotransferase EpsN